MMGCVQNEHIYITRKKDANSSWSMILGRSSSHSNEQSLQWTIKNISDVGKRERFVDAGMRKTLERRTHVPRGKGVGTCLR